MPRPLLQDQIDDWVSAESPWIRQGNGDTRIYPAVEKEIGPLDTDPGKAELTALYVSPRHVGRNRHDAQAEVEALSGEADIHALHLSSTLNAVGFYERTGFVRQYDSSYTLPCGTVLPCVRMMKRL